MFRLLGRGPTCGLGLGRVGQVGDRERCSAGMSGDVKLPSILGHRTECHDCFDLTERQNSSDPFTAIVGDHRIVDVFGAPATEDRVQQGI